MSRHRKHPSGRVLGFKDRFVALVESGEKRHTIRAGDFWRVGMTAHLYQRPRQKGMRLIFRAQVTKVEEIELRGGLHFLKPMVVRIDGVDLSCDECEALAVRDGFSGFTAMTLFWRPQLRKSENGIWYGQIVHWDFEQRWKSATRKLVAGMGKRKAA